MRCAIKRHSFNAIIIEFQTEYSLFFSMGCVFSKEKDVIVDNDSHTKDDIVEEQERSNSEWELSGSTERGNLTKNMTWLRGMFESEFQSKFATIQILGQGAYGCVFEAEFKLIGTRYAVKRIPLKESEINKALNEVRALDAFDHPNIVRYNYAWVELPPKGWQRASDVKLLNSVYSTKSFTTSDSTAFLYIQMELCQSTLAEWLMNNKERDLSRMKYWFKQIVSAVAYIHEMQKIHRDLKPMNILFATNDRLKVCDLGIVTNHAIIHGEDGIESVQSRTFSKGTPLYMAPEQMGMVYSSKVDIFALGLILAELLVPLTSEQAVEAFDNYRIGRPNNILRHSQDAETLVSALTQKSAANRPTCKQILDHPFLSDDQYEKSRMTKLEENFDSEFLRKFEVKRLVGYGGHGLVFEAFNKMDKNTYAVKRIPMRARDTEKWIEQLRRHASLRHEGIVGYYSSWLEKPPAGWQLETDDIILPTLECYTMKAMANEWIYRNDDTFFNLQMELCNGTLAEWLSANELRDINQAKSWFKQIVAALHFIHQSKLIHRDLKPRNILFGMDGCMKLCDLLHYADQQIENCQETDAERTMIGFGTRMYLAPEQCGGCPRYSSKVDIFALGLILIELCTKLTIAEMREVCDNFRARKPNNVLDHIPEAKGFVAWLTNIDPAERPTCAEILQHPFMLN